MRPFWRVDNHGIQVAISSTGLVTVHVTVCAVYSTSTVTAGEPYMITNVPIVPHMQLSVCVFGAWEQIAVG